MKRLLLLLTIAIGASPLFAQETGEQPWYEVEIIVFAHTDDYLDDEFWPASPELPATGDAVELKPAPGPGELPAAVVPGSGEGMAAESAIEPFQQLRPEEMRLGGAYRRLEASSRTEPLIHLGWRQPGLARETALPVRVTTAEPLLDPTGSPAVVFVEPPGDQVPGGMPAGETESEPVGPFRPARLDGQVKLILARYLHLETDLVYWVDGFEAPLPRPIPGESQSGTEADAEPVAALHSGPRIQPFIMRDSRRMRSGELHYIDHPAFGLLALVTPFELPKPEAPAATDAEATAAPAQAEAVTAPARLPASNPAPNVIRRD